MFCTPVTICACGREYLVTEDFMLLCLLAIELGRDASEAFAVPFLLILELE